ncbi:MAG: Gfo/Idh/MocA family oxidoreductase [Verrucomicrobia bacterium]|nr:Gfo/Idh/MocA family oxidoreductase [Verrucomicrobiota bacterium]
MTLSDPNLRVAVVGLGGICKLHFLAIAKARGVELAGVCDLNPDLVAKCSDELGVPGFTDLTALLADIRPDVVTVGTDTSSHARLTLMAARGGTRAVHCEKPMAVHPADAREMVSVSEDAGVLLTINHQRRMADVTAVRTFIKNGGLGDLVELRGYCAGDLLGDGTHVIDSLLAVAGDPEVTEVLGALDLSHVGLRHGHPVEAGSHLEIQAGHAVQVSVATGSFAARRAYQEYHVIGSRGSLWRAGDILAPNWFISDGQPGTHAAAFDPKLWFTYPQPVATGGLWREFDCGGLNSINGATAAYEQIVASLATGAPHPLDGRRTLTVQNVITAGYQSGITRAPVAVEAVNALEKFPLTLPQ